MLARVARRYHDAIAPPVVTAGAAIGAFSGTLVRPDVPIFINMPAGAALGALVGYTAPVSVPLIACWWYQEARRRG